MTKIHSEHWTPAWAQPKCTVIIPLVGQFASAQKVYLRASSWAAPVGCAAAATIYNVISWRTEYAAHSVRDWEQCLTCTLLSGGEICAMTTETKNDFGKNFYFTRDILDRVFGYLALFQAKLMPWMSNLCMWDINNEIILKLKNAAKNTPGMDCYRAGD